jgi:hypothetical protein
MQASLAGWTLDDLRLADAILLSPCAPFADDWAYDPHLRQCVFYLLVPFSGLFDSAPFPFWATGKLLFLGALVTAGAAHTLEDAGRGVITTVYVTLRIILRRSPEMVNVVHASLAMTVRFLSANHRNTGGVVVLAVHAIMGYVLGKAHIWAVVWHDR